MLTGLVQKSKFRGALVGTAVGDGLGAPFEGRSKVSPAEVAAVAWGHLELTYTDDTHMMIGVAESLIKYPDFDGADMARTLVRNYEMEPWRGYGPGPPGIFRRIKAGVAWDEAARDDYRGGSYGNGAAMRVAPVGLVYHDDPVKLREVAHQSARITHAHELGREGAALQAYAVALATGLAPGKAFDRADFLAKLTAFTVAGCYRAKLGRFAALLEMPDKGRVVAGLGNGVAALDSVPAAIFAFWLQPHSFEQAVLYAVSLGGDTDTIGAMAGAIAGAYLGVEAIPVGWRDRLENGGYIEALAGRLPGRAPGRG